MSSEKFEVYLDSKAEKEIEKLENQTKERIMKQIQLLRYGFLPELDIKNSKGKMIITVFELGLIV